MHDKSSLSNHHQTDCFNLVWSIWFCDMSIFYNVPKPSHTIPVKGILLDLSTPTERLSPSYFTVLHQQRSYYANHQIWYPLISWLSHYPSNAEGCPAQGRQQKMLCCPHSEFHNSFIWSNCKWLQPWSHTFCVTEINLPVQMQVLCLSKEKQSIVTSQICWQNHLTHCTDNPPNKGRFSVN